MKENVQESTSNFPSQTKEIDATAAKAATPFLHPSHYYQSMRHP